MSVQKARQGYKLVKSIFGKYEEIPEEWELKHLDTVAEVKGRVGWRGYTQEDFVEKGKGAISLGANNISKENRLDLSELTYVTWTKYNESPEIQASKNDIILAQRGSIGKVAIINQDLGKTTINPNVVLLKNFKSDNYFLYYTLTSRGIEKQMNSITSSTTIPLLTQGQIKKFKIPIPSKPEQQKIASILSNVDSLINQTQKIIEQTQRLKKGLMQKLLTKGIGHTKFKTEELGRKFLRYEIPQHWNVSKINEFATVHGRIGWKNLRADEYTDNGPLMLSVWSLVETAPYGVDYKEGINRLSEFRYEESPEIKLQDSDVLVAKDGDIGRIGFVKKLPEPATVNSHVVVVRVFDKSVNPEFLYWYMKAKPFQTYCIAFTSGTTVPLLTQKDLKNTKIPIPPLPEQEKISLILSNFATKIHSLEQKKSKLEALKKGLMQKLLTGQIRVKI